MKFRRRRVGRFPAQGKFQETAGFLALGPWKAPGFQFGRSFGRDNDFDHFHGLTFASNLNEKFDAAIN